MRVWHYVSTRDITYHAGESNIAGYFGNHGDKMGHATHRKKMIPRGEKLDSRKSRVNQTVKDLR